RLFLLRDRHDLAGVRRGGRVAHDPPHRDRPRRRVVLLQRRAACPDGEHRGKRDLTPEPQPAVPWLPRYRRCPARAIGATIIDSSNARKITADYGQCPRPRGRLKNYANLRPRATAWNPYRRDPVVGVGVGGMGSRRSAHGKGLAPLPADG